MRLLRNLQRRILRSGDMGVVIMLDKISSNSKSSMTTANGGKRPIRIIKRAETGIISEESSPPNPLKTENQSRREMAETITSWIQERRNMMQALPDLRTSLFWSPAQEDRGLERLASL